MLSIFHVLYASAAFRGIRSDGAWYFIRQLNFLSDGIFKIALDIHHPRFSVLALTQMTVISAYSILFIKNKFSLMFIYSFAQFAIPLISLCWSFFLAKHTKKMNIFFWNLFTYCCIILLYEIYSVTESIQGISFHFILWNYLSAEMEYKKRDILGIVFCIAMMRGTYEYTAYLGLFFFICCFYYAKQNCCIKSRIIKLLIGAGGLYTSLYTILFMNKTADEAEEILRFLKESLLPLPYLLQLNSLISISAVILLIIFAIKQSKIKNLEIYISSAVLSGAFFYLFTNLDISLNPGYEGIFRILPCFWIAAVFPVIFLQDIFKKSINIEKQYNLFCIVLLCGIFLTLWQINHTRLWNEDVQNMKKFFSGINEKLYIYNTNNMAFKYGTETYSRYIEDYFLAAYSILFSDTYEQNTIPVNTYYISSFNVFKERNTIQIPYPVLNIKNEYWDLAKCAEALYEFKKK